MEAEDDHQLARRLATEAGRLLLGLRDEERSAEQSRLRALGDARSNAFLLAALAQARPGDQVLSEERADDPARVQAQRVWIVDPLDGTREFSEGRSDWAVHVALWARGSLVAGAVALPGLDAVLATPSAHALGPPLPGQRPRLVVSRTRAPAAATRIQAALDATVIPMGSAGAKAMAVVRGDADIYAHAGGQYEWDSAAPVAVAQAAGLHASRLDGSPLAYNRPDPWLPDLLICRPHLAERVVAAAAAVG